MGDQVTAFVLAEEAASTEPQSIPGLPGLWSHDPAVAAVIPSALGLRVEDVEAIASEHGIEVKRVLVDPPAGPRGGRSRAELREEINDRGLEVKKSATVAEMIEALEAADAAEEAAAAAPPLPPTTEEGE